MRPLNTVLLLLVFSLTPLTAQNPDTSPDPGSAQSLMNEERWDEAKTLLEEVVTRPGKNPQAWHALARCHHELGEFGAAIKAYEKAAAQGGSAPRALYAAARAAATSGDGNQAIKLLGKVADAGGTPYLPALNAPEFTDLQQEPAFLAVLHRMKPCNVPEYRQFDFWLGEWDVMVGERLNAASRITQEQGGCVVREDYATLGGFAGTSLSFYDSTSGGWHQTWIDNLGQVLLLTGDVQGNEMVLTTAPGESMSRMTWTPNKDGTVRQLAESSNDGGKSWTTSFDGLYVARGTGE